VSEDVLRCAACRVELAPGMLACPACRKLVHTDRLKALAAEAETAEREGRLTDAATHWRSVLELLPAGSAQQRAVGATIRRISEAIDGSKAAPPAAKKGLGKATAGLGAVGLVLWQLKFLILSFLGKAKLLVTGLTSIPTLLSMFAWLALDRSRGVSFAIGLLLSIYVHEMGHVWALRLYGIKATAPMFVPGLGALVRLRQYPIDAREDARVGLAGPVWGCAAAGLALAAGLLLQHRTLLAVASIGATINVFNLIPFWQLDGARGFRALDTRQRTIVVVIAGAVALLLKQPLGWLVCAVGVARRKSDLPAKADARAFWTFALLLLVLSAIGWAGSPPS
jgi:Zn-dependent protease